MASRIASSAEEWEAIPKQEKASKKARLSLRNGYKRKLLRLPPQLRQKTIEASLKRTPIAKASKGQKASTARYRPLANTFLRQPENQLCQICTRRREAGENVLIRQATEVHHFAGRVGRLLCYVPYFIASCFHCRLWPHEHTKEARAMRLLAEAPDWNRFPSTGN